MAFPKTLKRVSRRRYPVFFTSATSSETFETWRIVCNRHMGLGAWELMPPRKPPMGRDGRLHRPWNLVERNVGRARGGMLRWG